MMRTMRKMAGACLLSALLAGAAGPARALATLDVWLDGYACSFTNAAGTVTPLGCEGSMSTATATMAPGESVRVDAVVHYRYHDDGLPLDGAQWLVTEPVNRLVRSVTQELGAIYVSTAALVPRPGLPPGLSSFGTSSLPLILGENDQPDDLSGSFAVYSRYRTDVGSTTWWRATAVIAVTSQTYSGTTAPIPEPGTWALTALGLALVGAAGATRRRTAPH